MRLRRSALGLTQVQLAMRVGRHQSVVSRWETEGLDVTPVELGAIAAAYEVDADDLLNQSDLPASVRCRSSRAVDRRPRHHLGVMLAGLRLRRHMDPVEVWRQTRITPYRLGRIERGCDASLDELKRLLHAYGATYSVVGGDRT